MNFGDFLMYIVSYFGLFTAFFFFLTFFENRKLLNNPLPKTFPKVTIAVPAYNEEKTLAKTVESLLKLDYPKDKLEIIIIDDGSTDGTYNIAKTFRNKGVKVFTKKNEGKGKTLNFALKHSTGLFFGALDADSFVDSDALKKIIGHFNDKEIMAVTPSLKVYKPQTILQKIQYMEYLIGIFLRKTFAFLGSIHVTPGPFTIYRKYFFQKYGGYDEHNLTEDIEIALRIKKNKFEIENSADACVYTVSPITFRALLKQRLRWYLGFIENVYHYRTLFSKKHGNLGLFILPASILSIFLIIIVLFHTTYRLFRNIIQTYLNYTAINFDIWNLFDFKFDFFYINLSPLFFISIITISCAILIIYMAKRISKEKKKIKVYYLLYFFFYWILFGFWWLIAGIYKLTGKRVVWGQKTL